MMSFQQWYYLPVSDDLTIGYHNLKDQFGDKTADQEAEGIQASYTMGGMTITAQW